MRILYFTLIATSVLMLSSCNKDDFELDTPDVNTFVQQLKNGTYNQFFHNDSGEKVWALMPEFDLQHIPQLIEMADDTTFLPNLDCVPLNPISSRTPWPYDRPGKIYLGEYLLWCAQYAIEGHFPSLDPFMVNTEVELSGYGISGEQVLEVRSLYLNWWQVYGSKEIIDETPHPLTGSSYRWF